MKYRVNVNHQAHESCKQLALNDIAVANLALSKPVVFAPYDDNRTLGGFILVRNKFTHATVAAGMIRHNLRRAQNVHRQALALPMKTANDSAWTQRQSHLVPEPVRFRQVHPCQRPGKGTALRASAPYILDGDNIGKG